jgi:hypothetical protein
VLLFSDLWLLWKISKYYIFVNMELKLICLESFHPVRDNYKLKETVHIPGARCLYLRFDTRCASQYDYDKVI